MIKFRSLSAKFVRNLRTESVLVRPVNLRVDIAIPAFNEEKNIGEVLREINNIGYCNILVIDGLSSDDTLKVAAENNAKTVSQHGHGKGQAIKQVLTNNYLDSDALILMDADGSMSPSEIPIFVQELQFGADVVKGSRFISGGGTHDITFARRLGNSVMTSMVNMLYGTRYTDLCYGFVALNRRAIEMIAPILESNFFEIETEIFIKAKKLGLKVVEVPSIEYQRKNGKSNLKTFHDGYKIMKTIFASLLLS